MFPLHKSTEVMRNRRLDDADKFRESSLKAIRNRKKYARILYWVLVAVAAIMLFLVYAAYKLDN